MERWTALPLLVLRGVVQPTISRSRASFLTSQAGGNLACSAAAGALQLFSSASGPLERSGQLRCQALVSLGAVFQSQLQLGWTTSPCLPLRLASGMSFSRSISGNPALQLTKAVVVPETSETTLGTPGASEAAPVDHAAEFSQSRSDSSPHISLETTHSAEVGRSSSTPTEISRETKRDNNATVQQDLRSSRVETSSSAGAGQSTETALLDPTPSTSVSRKGRDILVDSTAQSLQKTVDIAASASSDTLPSDSSQKSNPTTLPSSASNTSPPSAAASMSGRDSSQEPNNSHPLSSSSQLEDTANSTPVKKTKNAQAGAHPADEKAGLDSDQPANHNPSQGHERPDPSPKHSQESQARPIQSHRIEPHKPSSYHRRWGSERQLGARDFPSAAVHVLAPVEYVTATYGNLEITHPRRKMPAPNLDSRPEGFRFTGMEVVFFGTSSNIPSLWRNTSCTAVRVDKSTFIIDCGDGSLQQLLRGSPFRLGSIERIFITHMHGDHVHGLAALLIFLGLRTRGAHSRGESRPRSGEDPVMPPIHIYGPLGLRHLLRLLLSATHASVETGYAVHELLPREEREQRARRIDEFLLPHADELPGRDVVADSDATWHVHEDANVIVKAAELQHSVPCFGYVIAEKVKPGRFDRTRAEELGINRSDFGALQNGESRTLPGGRTIRPHDVMAPPRRGRKIVVLGDTSDASALYRIGWDCDLLIHEATVLRGKSEREAAKMGHSTASMAGTAAREMMARSLVLTHISPKHQNMAHPGVDAAKSAYGSNRVMIAEDFTRIQVGYEEEPAKQRHVDALLRPRDRKLSPEEQWKKVTRIKGGG